MKPLILTTLFALFFGIVTNVGQAALPIHPLAPPDTSSPRATLNTFLDNMNSAVQAYKAGNRKEARSFARRAARCLNLNDEPPALMNVLALYAVLYLKETLDRIEIPPEDQIPDAKEIKSEKISSWTIPFTEITIAATKTESSPERFLFTGDTVRKAESYYSIVKNLPYRPDSGGGAMLEQLRSSGSLILPKTFIESLPAWSRRDIYGQAIWQWLGLLLYFGVATAVLLILHKIASQTLCVFDDKFGSNLSHTVGGLILPITLILLSKLGLWFVVYGLRFLDAHAYVPIAFVFLIISYGGWIWLIGAILNRVATVFVAVGGYVRGGVDDQLIRIGFQLITVIIITVMSMSLGARLGLPTYSLITGLGIGGLAVALAGREALSNIIGTIMIILDRPFQLGDYIVPGAGERGEVAEVGLRSTRIRTRDDVIISIPNSVIANAKMINESAPFPMSRIRVKLGVAYDSDLPKVEQILIDVARQNELVLPDPAPRVRFRGFGDSALEIELLCWIDTPDLRGRVIHELNWSIKEEFEKQEVEMPYPQRNVHIRSDK